MILDITDKSLSQVKNHDLRSYAGIYVSINNDFMHQVRSTGIEVDTQDYSEEVDKKLAALSEGGAWVRNNSKSVVIKEISPACVACQTGVGSATFFVSLQCHRDCYYCFNPNQQDFQFYQNHTRDVIGELEDVLRNGPETLTQIALTGGEPLLHKQEAVNFFKYATENFPDTYSRLYTCGDHINDDILQQLKDAGLKEIRFSIRMYDFEKGQRSVFDRISLAKKYIPQVMVEMPVLPDTLEEMKDILLELDRIGLYSINMLELCYPLNNAEVYREKGFKVKARPFHVLYDYWYAGGLPISRSELVCLELVQFALDKKLKMGVHYCSVENKQTGQVYQQNAGISLPKYMSFSENDYFIKSAKVFGGDIDKVKQVFKRRGITDFQMNQDKGYLEFNLKHVEDLKKLDIEIGISSNVVETRDGNAFLRELKVDVTTPRDFRFEVDA